MYNTEKLYSLNTHNHLDQNQVVHKELLRQLNMIGIVRNALSNNQGTE